MLIEDTKSTKIAMFEDLIMQNEDSLKISTFNPIYLGSQNSKNTELGIILSSDQAAQLSVTLLQNQNINLKSNNSRVGCRGKCFLVHQVLGYI